MKALEGFLVVSVEQAVAAPFCTARLAEAGARVIKIERPGGDFARGYDRAGGGDSSYFVWLNQGKESVVLDFKQADDAALLERMIARADVFVQNLAPGAMARAGFASDALQKRFPRLVTCDISGYGEDPAVVHLKSYDLLVQAETGLVAVSGGSGELGRIGVSACDIGAGMTAHAGIVEALLNRQRTGEGAAIKVSLFDVTAEWMTVPLLHHDYGAGAPGRVGLRHPSVAPYGGFETADGTTVVISVQNEREWVRFCEVVLNAPEMAGDSRFASNNDRVANRQALDAEIGAIVARLPAETFRQRLTQAAIAYGSVNSVAEFSRHPALARRRAAASNGTEIELPISPIRCGESPRMASGRAPRIGEHTASVRAEFS